MHFTSGPLSRFEAYIKVFAAVIISLTNSGKSDYTVRRMKLLTHSSGRTPFDLGM